MKRLILSSVLAASSLACVSAQGDAPVHFLGTQKLDATCAASGTAQSLQGLLDISGGASSYVMGVNVESNVVNQQITIGASIFTNQGHADFTMTEEVITYSASEPVAGLPKEEHVPLYGVFRPSAGGTGTFMTLYALGTEAVTALKGTVTPGHAAVTVLATVKGVGKLSSGATVETNEITFPVIVINSGYTSSAKCGSLTSHFGDPWPCGNVGQDSPICQ